MITFESQSKFYVGTSARLVETERELAWAEKHVQQNKALRWILGNFVESSKANSNGHIFPLEQLEAAKTSVVHSPLNMLHRAHHIVGHYAAVEMIYPKGVQADDGVIENPYLEALAAFYSYYFPEEYADVEKAHSEGSLAFSMEAVPETITCPTCTKEFAYDGRSSPTYCSDLQVPGAAKRLNKPHFTAGALILPPVRPGWKQAKVTELSSLIERYSHEAEIAYDQVKAEFPHLDPRSWEAMMAQILKFTDSREVGRNFNTKQRQRLAKSGAALPDGSFPIVTPKDLTNALQAVGRATPSKKGQVIAHIKKRAKAIGQEKLLPAGWDALGSD